MKELKQNLVQFKQVTIEIIMALRQDEIIKLDDLLDSRQMVIDYHSDPITVFDSF